MTQLSQAPPQVGGAPLISLDIARSSKPIAQGDLEAVVEGAITIGQIGVCGTDPRGPPMIMVNEVQDYIHIARRSHIRKCGSLTKIAEFNNLLTD